MCRGSSPESTTVMMRSCIFLWVWIVLVRFASGLWSPDKNLVKWHMMSCVNGENWHAEQNQRHIFLYFFRPNNHNKHIHPEGICFPHQQLSLLGYTVYLELLNWYLHVCKDICGSHDTFLLPHLDLCTPQFVCAWLNLCVCVCVVLGHAHVYKDLEISWMSSHAVFKAKWGIVGPHSDLLVQMFKTSAGGCDSSQGEWKYLKFANISWSS